VAGRSRNTYSYAFSRSTTAALIANGKGKMPAFKGKLSDEEISAVVTYVKGLK